MSEDLGGIMVLFSLHFMHAKFGGSWWNKIAEALILRIGIFFIFPLGIFGYPLFIYFMDFGEKKGA